MQDFFCNEKLSNIIPQFNKKDLNNQEIKDRKVFEQCQKVLCGFLGGAVTAKGIEVRNKSIAKVTAIVTAAKQILEAMYDNSGEIISAIKTNKKLYTTLANVSQATELDTNKKKLNFLAQIMDNIYYNPEFNAKNKAQSNSSYKQRQEAWKKKVNYKE